MFLDRVVNGTYEGKIRIVGGGRGKNAEVSKVCQGKERERGRERGGDADGIHVRKGREWMATLLQGGYMRGREGKK